MSHRGHCPPQQPDDAGTDVSFSALLEDSAEELYENAPCGYLSTLMDGTIAKINGTLLEWLGYRRDEVIGRMRFSDLLSVGGKLYHETHFAPLLHLHGEAKGIALELRTAGRDQLPVLVTSVVKRGSGGEPLLIRTTIFDARERRSYERELLRGRRIAEEARKHADADRARLQEALAVLQKSLLPAALPQIPNLRSAAHYHTASPDQLGGDFYDLFPLAGDRWAFFLGDVCGKGPEAAAVTSLIRYTLRTTAMHNPDPVATLITLNSVLYQRYTGGDTRFCTTIFGTLEPEGDSVRVRLAAGGAGGARPRLRRPRRPGDGGLPRPGPRGRPRAGRAVAPARVALGDARRRGAAGRGRLRRAPPGHRGAARRGGGHLRDPPPPPRGRPLRRRLAPGGGPRAAAAGSRAGGSAALRRGGGRGHGGVPRHQPRQR
ncbi:MAG TPA: SpoIIE family protein phosphatase, partial [Amycolatopsis sp.]|nr:SpoIIE family protein phosphatase [Amycolatopsis sp.]